MLGLPGLPQPCLLPCEVATSARGIRLRSLQLVSPTSCYCYQLLLLSVVVVISALSRSRLGLKPNVQTVLGHPPHAQRAISLLFASFTLRRRRGIPKSALALQLNSGPGSAGRDVLGPPRDAWQEVSRDRPAAQFASSADRRAFFRVIDLTDSVDSPSQTTVSRSHLGVG